MSSSDESTEQILTELGAIRSVAATGVLDDQALGRARGLVGHADNTVRWQALIAVSLWVSTQPEPVWEVVLEHGESEDDDMRAGVACVLLEALLEYHYDAYFPLLRERIQAGAPLLADTLSTCWFGDAKEPWSETRQLVLRATDRGYIRIRGKRYERVPHDGADDTSATGNGRCRACGVKKGDIHDTVCKMERCPACEGRAWTCECVHDD